MNGIAFWRMLKIGFCQLLEVLHSKLKALVRLPIIEKVFWDFFFVEDGRFLECHLQQVEYAFWATQ
jgi:hypothetical protein